MQEFVVPKSIPKIFDIILNFLSHSLSKSYTE